MVFGLKIVILNGNQVIVFDLTETFEKLTSKAGISFKHNKLTKKNNSINYLLYSSKVLHHKI